jgi:hypothetical protein
MIHPSLLHAKVAAYNRLHQKANELFPILKALFEPYLGQKVLKSDGELLKKIKESLPKVEGQSIKASSGFRFNHSKSCYSLYFQLHCEEMGYSHANHSYPAYVDASLYIGDISGDELTKLAEPPNFRADYDVDTILALRVETERLKRLAQETESKLHPFGLSDR